MVWSWEGLGESGDLKLSVYFGEHVMSGWRLLGFKEGVCSTKVFRLACLVLGDNRNDHEWGFRALTKCPW